MLDAAGPVLPIENQEPRIEKRLQMPSDSPSQGTRRHFHRGRRGHDRRSVDRRSTPPGPQSPPEQGPRGDHVDVEQIMREIRSRIAQRHGVELTEQQVQELAARRLESILDPRTIKPSLLEQLRRSAGARPDSVAAADRAAVPYEFEDTTLYDSPNAFTRFIRKLLNPILKLFFNPNPLIRALHIQSQLNADAIRREAERDQRQAEWNALHYEILQRVVNESAKVTLELQSLALKVEALAGKVDFNERRVRGIEAVASQPRGAGREREREREPAPAAATPAPAATGAIEPAAVAAATPEATPGEMPRRRRRRRRGRRGGGAPETLPAAVGGPAGAVESLEGDETEEIEPDAADAAEIVTTGTDDVEQLESGVPAAAPSPEPAPERVTPQLSSPEPAAREEAAPDVQAAEEPQNPDDR
jgi:hypothetical protein